jgi:hypothetical protein
MIHSAMDGGVGVGAATHIANATAQDAVFTGT